MPQLYAAEPLEQRLLLAVLYVDLNAPGSLHDGRSWDSAYADLQPALINARAGDQIRIAAGTYKPTADADRTKSFQLKSGVSLYGGYAGHNAANPDQRDLRLFPTILSGEIGDPGTTADNSYHVVVAKGVDATAILDGVSILAGNANGVLGSPDSCGGGMYNFYASPTINNCSFSGSSADFNGGGMYNDSSLPILINCSFSENSVGYSGSGVCNNYSSPAFIECSFSRNLARRNGSGMFNTSSDPTLTNCTFNANSASGGGGMFNVRSEPILTDCRFSGNSATAGGGMYNEASSSPTLTNCSFSGNLANVDGGGMYNDFSHPTLTNCTFSGNVAVRGGAMHNYFCASPRLINSILWGNTLQQIVNMDLGTPAITYSLVEGGWEGVGNLNADPQFVRNPSPGPDGQWATADDDYGDLRLRSTSPALNVGSNAAVPPSITTDLDGNPRIVFGTVDLGAYEAGVPNHSPVASDLSVSLDEDASASVSLCASDADGNSLTYKLLSGPTHGTLIGTAPNLVYTPDANYNGSDTFTYLANDGTVDSLSATVSITVKVVNDAPSFTKGADQSAQAGAGTQTVVGWAANRSVGPANESGQTFTFLALTDNDGLFAVKPAINPSGTLTYTPAASVSGTAIVTVQLKDSGGTANGGQDTSAAQTFSITITPSNTPPVLAAIPDQSIDEGMVLSFRAVATDSDLPAQTLSFSLDGGAPAGASIDPVTGVFTWAPALYQAGQYTFRVCVSDNGTPSLSVTQPVTIIVKDVIVPQLQVTNVTATPSGFDLQFNVPIDLSKLNLYDGVQNKGRAADLAVTDAAGKPVSGTAVWEAATNTLHFVKSGGLLAVGTYTVTLFSRADGFVGLDGDKDGNAGGNAGGNFTATVPVAAGTGPIVSLADIARGPKQSFNLPVKVDNAAGVLRIYTELVFDPTLLSVSDIALAAGLPADWTAVANLKAPGRMAITAYGTTALSVGAKDLLLVK
ncbi:MAG: Ig-like domain-containing protein, partial [Bacillota bacterium]